MDPSKKKRKRPSAFLIGDPAWLKANKKETVKAKKRPLSLSAHGFVLGDSSFSFSFAQSIQ